MPTEPNLDPSAAVEPPRRRADELLSVLAQRMGAHFSASRVFGDPVEREGVTVIPVAAARFGFGAGTGSQAEEGQDGEGGGVGGAVGAIGYIEVKDGRSRFVPIVRPARMLALVLAGILAALLISRPSIQKRRMSVRPWR